MNRFFALVAGLLLTVVFSSTQALAQLPDGSIAPDFTATDITGDGVVSVGDLLELLSSFGEGCE
jgi:hypothetical protein